MKSIVRKMGTVVTVMLFVGSFNAFAQKKTKTYHENFNIGNDAVVEINTSYADIEFETWNKNQVDIEAVVEIEATTEEEANDYFKNAPVKIMGNSKNIEISTEWGRRGNFGMDAHALKDMHIEFLDEFNTIENVHSIAPLLELPEILEIPEMPPMPPINIQPFDYESYKKDGEAYLKEWRKGFEKGFGKEYQKKMEEWGKHLASKREDVEKKRKELEKHRGQAQQEHLERLQEQRKVVQEIAEEQRERAMTLRRESWKSGDENRAISITVDTIGGNHKEIFLLGEGHRNAPNIFYTSKTGKDKNVKIKKTIRIKLPKSTVIKMNVRHGEVKLAENTNNLNATLSYASLLAATIDGDKTNIKASYSPVSVQKWNYGQLEADYSDKVSIKEVGNLALNATFSKVTIENLLQKAFVKNSFGSLHINGISKDFTDLDINLQNAELFCKLPITSFNVVVNGSNSDLDYPKELKLTKTKNGYDTLHKGFNLKNNSGKSINITSKYTDVVLK